MDDYSEMRTQLKNRDDRRCEGLSALSRGIVGSARGPAKVIFHFFLRGWCGLFSDPPECRFHENADRCRLPPGRPGGGSGGPYRKFDAFGLLRARARMHKLQGCGDLGVGVASRTRNGGMVLGAGEFGGRGCLWEDFDIFCFVGRCQTSFF